MPAAETEARARHRQLRATLAGEPLPLAFVDLDAFDHNLDVLLAACASGGKRLRLASKSLRCLGLLQRALARGGDRIAGVLSYAAREAAFLVEHGVRDVFVAYPTLAASDLQLLSELNAKDGVRAGLVVDGVAHLDAVQAALGPQAARLPLVLDVDVTWRPFGLHVGVRRSPLRSAAQVLALWRDLQRRGLRLGGIMAYEASVAGLTDRNPFTRLQNPVKRWIRRRSAALAAARRAEVAAALRAEGAGLELFNGGGTGSIAVTASEPAVTEVAAGSGLLCGHLFDYYRPLGGREPLALRPCAHFALQVVRASDPGFVTCHGGGYVASGEPGRDRLPQPVFPPGLTLLGLEGAGEVQTPLRLGRGAQEGRGVQLGDLVLFRHAKSGELAEHFDTYLGVQGDRIVDRFPTYRGAGRVFV